MRKLFVSYVAFMKDAPYFANETITGDDLTFNSREIIKQFESAVKEKLKAKYVTVLYFKFMEN